MKKVKLWILLLACFCGIAVAASSPVSMLQSTSDEMIAALQKNRSRLKSNPAYAETLARNILLPHADIPTMSRLALGRNVWTQATPAQRRDFMNQFTTLMIRTYASAFAAYTNEKVKFLPIRGGVGNKQRVQVNSLILQQGGPSIPVSYRLVLRKGQWKVYDITVDGVSMVRSFRSQFANEMSQGGMTGLLAAMKKHNASR